MCAGRFAETVRSASAEIGVGHVLTTAGSPDGIKSMETTISTEEIEILDRLFDPWERESIRTDEDLIRLGEIFDEDE